MMDEVEEQQFPKLDDLLRHTAASKHNLLI